MKKCLQTAFSQNKYLLTADSHLIEKLGEGRVTAFGKYFSLWSGAFAPFFSFHEEEDPIDLVVRKVPTQLRALPIIDQSVIAELETFTEQCSLLR